MLKSFLISFALTLTTIFAVYNYVAYSYSFDRAEQMLEETKRLLAEERQALEELQFTINETYLEKDF